MIVFSDLSALDCGRYGSVVFVKGHVVLVGMVASGAYLRGFVAFEDVAADKALPADGVVAFPYSALLHHLEIACEAVEVVLLGFSYREEVLGDLGESLFLSSLGGFLIWRLFTTDGADGGGRL